VPTETVTHSGIGIAALAALRKRRKKFSASRNMNMAEGGGKTVKPEACCAVKGGKKQLQRASSVPTRASEAVTLISHRRHEQTQSQQQSVELGHNEILTPSTTEESVATYSTGVGGGGVSVGSCSREPLLASGSVNSTNNTSSQASTHRQPQDPQNKSHNGSVVVLPNLPGIQPLSGHNMSAGWL
jgi:hypothetical protein